MLLFTNLLVLFAMFVLVDEADNSVGPQSCTLFLEYFPIIGWGLVFIRSMMYQYGMSESRSASFPVEKTRHLLDDSFLESQSPMRNDPRSTSVSNGLTLGKRNTRVCTF